MDADASLLRRCTTPRACSSRLNLDVFGVKSYPELASRYVAGGLASATFGGKIYTLPYQGNSMSLFINNKAVRGGGLDPGKDAPKTWKDIKALGPKLKKVAGQSARSRRHSSFPTTARAGNCRTFQPLTEQFGGQDPERRRQDGLPQQSRGGEGADAVAGRDQGCGDPKTTKNTASNPNQDFLDGFTAMWITGTVGDVADPASPIKNDFTVVAYPQVDPAKPHTIVYGWAWGVNKNKPESAEGRRVGLRPLHAREAGRVARRRSASCSR